MTTEYKENPLDTLSMSLGKAMAITYFMTNPEEHDSLDPDVVSNGMYAILDYLHKCKSAYEELHEQAMAKHRTNQ